MSRDRKARERCCFAPVLSAPAAGVSPSSVNFQSVVVNTTSSARTVTLQNTGTGPMNVTSVSTAAPFSDTTTCIGTLAAGNSCTISVTFAPIALGSASGSLAIADDVGTQTVSLSGSGVAPVTVSPTSLNLGTVAVGSTTAAKSVTLQNRQNVGLSFTSIVASAGFAIASNTCSAGVPAGEACSVGVTFTPSAMGAASGTLTLTDSAANSPQTAALSGTGGAPVTLSSSALSFGNVVAGNTSSAKSVTLTNSQNAALSFTGITVTAGFAIASNTCGSGIGGLATCTVGVKFSPGAVGAATGSLTFTDSAGNSPQTVSLTGAGTAPVTLSATTLSFGTVTVGSTSSAKTVTVTNRSSQSLSFTGIAACAGFSVSSIAAARVSPPERIAASG